MRLCLIESHKRRLIFALAVIRDGAQPTRSSRGVSLHVTLQRSYCINIYMPTSLGPIAALKTLETRGKVYSLESTHPRESEFAPTCVRNSLLSYYLFIIAKLFKVKDDCAKLVYVGRNRRFSSFLASKIHTRLAVVTGNELVLTFPPRNLPKKFRPDPSTFYSVTVTTDRRTDKQTDKRTPVKT